MRKLNAEISSKVNRSLVLAEIHREPMISRAGIAERSGLDRSAITHILNYLIDAGLVEEVCKGDASSRGGRRPILLRIRESARNIVAIEVGLDHVTGIVADLGGNELHREVTAIKRGEEPIPLLTRVVEALAGKVPGLKEKLAIIGISSPGIINTEARIIHLNLFHRWREASVGEGMREHFGVPVLVENDANAAALGELYARAGEESPRSLIYLFIRESRPGSPYPLGVGGAVIFNGRLWRGSTFCSGEVSQSINNSFSGIMERLSATRPNLKGATLTELIEHSQQGDEELDRVLDELAQGIGAMLGQVATFLDPDSVLLYVHPPEGKDMFLRKIEAAFNHDQYSELRPAIPFLWPALASEATLRGVIHLALEKIFIRDTTESSILIQ